MTTKSTFSPRDLILVGGRSRGREIYYLLSNVANNVYESGKTAVYFTIEMDSRAILTDGVVL